MRYVSRDGAGVRIVLRTLESLRYDEIDGMENDKRRHLIEQKRPKARWTLACTSARSTCVNRELKHATFLSHERQPEVNILQARTLVSPRFSN